MKNVEHEYGSDLADLIARTLSNNISENDFNKILGNNPTLDKKLSIALAQQMNVLCMQMFGFNFICDIPSTGVDQPDDKEDAANE